MMYYFAYSTDLSHREMKRLCPDSKPLFKAQLPNFKLIFTGWERKWRGGVASIMASKGARVLGGVYEISDRDLRMLDRHHGSPTAADRLTVMVAAGEGELVEAIVYVRKGRSEESQPSQEYMTAMRRGYDDWG
jgi:gamma-glutamylcyclotransferase (GGCT)/AIG2-like uncharacterized protein YtfP